MPFDGFGRQIDYLRISLLDQCNLQCAYCMPVEQPAGGDLLTPAQIGRVVEAAVQAGFHKFRLTGGEPTLRADLLEIVERIARIPGADDLAMTTNGVLLSKLATPLRRAGLHRVNIHLDTPRDESLARLVWSGIAAAAEVGLTPIKINCVVTRGSNDLDVVQLAMLTVQNEWHVRFIELMPLGDDECARFATERFVPSIETRERIEAALGPLMELGPMHRSDEARNFFATGAAGVIGFISPISEPYCGSCNRLRLTANGHLRMCLLNDKEIDIAAALRRGAGIGELEALIRAAVSARPVGHSLRRGQPVRARRMHQIGG